MTKKILLGLIVLLMFTEALIIFHNSPFEKKEYDRICNSIYDEKVWIDTCYVPYKSEIKTFELAKNIEIGGIILTGISLLYFQKFHFKN